MGCGFERESCFDQIALERRTQTGAVGLQELLGWQWSRAPGTTIVVAQIELDRAIIEIAPLERVIRRALVVESGTELPPADRERALGEQRPEAAAAATESAHRFVEHIGQP